MAPSMDNMMSCPQTVKGSRPVSPTSTRRTISFSPDVTIHEILHLFNYSPEEIKSTWNSRTEILAFKKENKTAVQNMALLGDDDDDDGCFRGLEGKTPLGVMRKRQNKAHGRWAVLWEQKQQRETGFWDPEAIADAYYDCTEHCQASAQMLGFRDEQDAKEAALMANKENSSGGPGYSYNRIILKIDENLSQVLLSSAA
jgi:hypothetical protein